MQNNEDSKRHTPESARQEAPASIEDVKKSLTGEEES